VQLWDVKSGQPVSTLPPDAGGTLAYSPDGLTLATGSSAVNDNGKSRERHEVRLWDARSRQAKAVLSGHANAITSLAFSPDGRSLASSSYDREVRLWDLETGQARLTLRAGSLDWTVIHSLAFSPDGLTLVCGSGNNSNYYKPGMVQLWDTKTGQLKATFTAHWSRINAVAVSPDGSHLASVSDDRTVCLWDVGPGPTDPDQAQKERRALVTVRRQFTHRKLAESAERESDWFAAAFHLNQLLKDKPDDADLKRRRDQARDKLKPPTPMEPLPRPREEPQR
jgi:WD40 repeat protein